MIHWRKLAAVAAAALLTSSCSGVGGNPVSDAERRLGAEQHPQLLAEFGGAYEGDEAAYLKRIGDKLATAAELEGLCTFTLVNSDVVNAFAVPGCFIYVTRGLLAIVNSEGELASVLAHEIGHIAADHSERQQKRSIWRSLGVMAIATITGSRELSQLAGSAATYFTLRYSRKHEYEADDLGLAYLQDAGYDPFAAADMLASLERHGAYQARVRGVDEARSIPEWALTHPLTENRIARARDEAKDAAGRPGTLPEYEAAFLRRVDGLLYGDDPEQGFVIGRSFAHPVMRIAFEAPPGFTLTNSPQAILIEGPDGMRGEFAGAPIPPGGLEAYVQTLLGELLGDTPAQVDAVERSGSNGMPALLLQALVSTGEGNVLLSLAAYDGGGGQGYHFLLVSGPGSAPSQAVGSLFQSFRMLGPADVAALRPRYIRVQKVRGGDSLRTVAGRMAADHGLDLFLLLNGRDRGEPLRAGETVKVVSWEPPR